MNTASNHSIYARWTANTYTVTFNRTNFGNGEVVYFNPVTAQVCDSSEAISTIGYKDGCMKWYAFLDDGSDTIKLLLDHNTTAFIAYNNDATKTTPDTVNAQLALDVSNWNNTIKNSARLISAEEVNEIAPAAFNWNVNKFNHYYYLYTGIKSIYQGETSSNSYGWLFDNTHICENYGCNVTQEGTAGYWTGTYASYANDGHYAWRVHYYGSLHTDYIIDNDSVGIRPVIEVKKELLKISKEVTYNSTYGDLPILSKAEYIFNGWYTTGGTKVESTTSVTNSSNHTLYAQWTKNKYVVILNSNVFNDGDIVYFNPVTNSTCNESESVSTLGTKDGCMKWHAFLDDGSKNINLLLDHNTTGIVQWNSNLSGTTPDTVNAQLQLDIANWNSSVKNTARLITANEVYQIVKPTNIWNINDKNSWFNLHLRNQDRYSGEIGSNTYAWLINNTVDCYTYGCSLEQSGTYGYWTSNYASDNEAWAILHDGFLGTYDKVNSSYLYGVRPVITVNKELLSYNLERKIQVTYNMQYNNLPTLTNSNYIFLGWYTTGGVKITNDTIMTNQNDHKLYAQWVKKENIFTYSGTPQEFTTPISGTYKIELWGASGSINPSNYHQSYTKAPGAYTSGTINIDANQKLYIYIGEEGKEGPGVCHSDHYKRYLSNTFNGGGALDSFAEGGSGGSATDIRLVNGNWNSSSSLNSRIMVAAGGAASGGWGIGGAGGGLIGIDGNITPTATNTSQEYTIATGGTQFDGGKFTVYLQNSNAEFTTNTIGSFGIGGKGAGKECSGAGGGSGYYGGAGARNMGGAGGGSSFISGHTGSVAITSSSSTTPRKDSNNVICNSTLSSGYNSSGYNSDHTCSLHYSGHVFDNTIMIDGNGYDWSIVNGTLVKTQKQMPNPYGNYYSSGAGHIGNGYARITYLGE